ncbi:MAG: efflux RND transporter permease subunit [Prevotellaceae bacterium]|jgi:HAE1 family hydrophobic/amphiphilic exporter-1|nr:efflux RND transporter permease subunit [Prevotellaceae bacterium]
MKIYETAVRKPVSTILIFIGAIVLGLFSLNRLSIDLYPEIEVPMLTVVTTYPGTSAADIEQNITRILEDNLNTVSDLKKITSRSQENISIVILEFEWGTNLDEAANDVRDALGRIETYLPDNSEKPFIVKFSTSMMPILFLSATANESYEGLYKLLDEKVANPLNRINGVGAVNISGAPTREVQVNVDPQKIEAYHLTIEQIGQIIKQENANIPAGAMDIGSERFSVRIEGEFAESAQLKDVVVTNIGGREIRIKDIATVKDTIKKMTVEETINGQRGVNMFIQKQSGANTVEIAKAVREALPRLAKDLPSDVKMEIFFDSSDYITNSIDSLTETVVYAFIFVVLVVLFFLGRWRATIIIALTIPVSLISSFVYLMFTGGTINVISLSSLSIAIGMVVDDAIVVLENVVKHLERKARPRDAAIYGTNEVWLAVLAASLTVVAVFLPLTMTGGLAGIMFQQLGWIVSIVIIISTVAAVTLTPMLSSKMLMFRPAHTYKGLGIIFKPVDKALDNLDNGYARLLHWAVHHRALTIFGAFGIFLISLLLLTQVPTDFMPESDNGRVEATVELPVNANLEQTTEVAHRIEKALLARCPEIRLLSVSSGTDDQGGFAALFGNSGVNIISYGVILVKKHERTRTQAEIADVLREEIAKFPEVVKYSVSSGGGGGMGAGNTVDVKVFGYDFNETTTIAEELARRMRGVKGARDVKISREDMKVELQVDFDREKLAKFGVNTVTAANYVRNRINGLTASLYREDGEEYDIIVRYDEPFRTAVGDVENILLYNNAGGSIRLSEVATVVERFTPPIIEREDRQRVVTVSAALGAGAALGEVAAATQVEIEQITLPPTVSIAMAGAVEDQREMLTDMMTLLALIIILVYIVMATQFESFSMPFIIMLSIPFAFTGVFLALWMTGTSLGMVALIGAIMLVGIVVKNGIVIVDFTNLQRERGLPLNEAVITAGKSRLRPVLMTTLTTILGMIPLAVGSGEGAEIWKPMGIAVVGGLTFSTLLTLLVIPAIYSTFNIGKVKKERKSNAVETSWEGSTI